MKNQSITEAMLQFIEESPTAFHAAANVEALLLENGFEKLENLAEGALVPGGSYYTMQNGSAVLAVKRQKIFCHEKSFRHHWIFHSCQ